MVNYQKGDFGRCDCSKKNVHMSGDFGNYFGNTEDTSTDLPDYVSTAQASSEPKNIIFYTAILLTGIMVLKKMRAA